ncbi:MAG: hypothetical protein HC806_09835, partial [Anaerolineae bacterium]|nr:hypothetical protein [Anaerolineae bacterium]
MSKRSGRCEMISIPGGTRFISVRATRTPTSPATATVSRSARRPGRVTFGRYVNSAGARNNSRRSLATLTR